jgi:predicted metal-dependent hydrolase
MRSLFQRTRKVPERQSLDATHLVVGDRDILVNFRCHAQARRLVLRLTATGDAAVVTVPHGVSRAQAIEFVERSGSWLSERLAAASDRILLEPGAVVPLRGEEHEVRALDSRRGSVVADTGCRIIYVPGDPHHRRRRLGDWLKSIARADLQHLSQKYAATMEVRINRITVRDQRSRWGSCSRSGGLSFSWRLILAPTYVLDYVVAHEVAHLRHMDHGPRFWRLVLRHCPDAQRAKTWLKVHGQSLHRYIV